MLRVLTYHLNPLSNPVNPSLTTTLPRRHEDSIAGQNTRWYCAAKIGLFFQKRKFFARFFLHRATSSNSMDSYM